MILRRSGDRVDRPHILVERVELLEIGSGVRLVRGLAGGVGCDQRIADVHDIALDVGDALPSVRIDVGVTMIVVSSALSGLHALGGASTSGAAVPEDLISRPIQPSSLSPFATTSLASARGARPRRRGIDVRVAVGPTSVVISTRSPPTFFDKIGENREGRDHLGLVLRRRREPAGRNTMRQAISERCDLRTWSASLCASIKLRDACPDGRARAGRPPCRPPSR
jgi:hypothetical protein